MSVLGGSVCKGVSSCGAVTPTICGFQSIKIVLNTLAVRLERGATKGFECRCFSLLCSVLRYDNGCLHAESVPYFLDHEFGTHGAFAFWYRLTETPGAHTLFSSNLYSAGKCIQPTQPIPVGPSRGCNIFVSTKYQGSWSPMFFCANIVYALKISSNMILNKLIWFL